VNAIGGPAVGILAGMAVTSTAPFISLVIDECRRQYGAVHQHEFPHLIVFTWPTEVRFDDQFDAPKYARRVAEGVRWLSGTGVDFIAVPANLPHVYWDQWSGAATVPLLNMIDIAAEIVPAEQRVVALLGTRPTRDSRIYHRRLEARGMRVVATDTMQELLDEILPALWRADDPAAIRRRWETVVDLARQEGATCVLLACTDFNAIERFDDVPLPVFDATRALAARVVSTWLERAKV
jgi:aspartate racemase